MGGDHLFGRYFAEPKADSGQFSFNLNYTPSSPTLVKQKHWHRHSSHTSVFRALFLCFTAP